MDANTIQTADGRYYVSPSAVDPDTPNQTYTDMNGLLNASNKLLKKASTLYTVNDATTTGYILAPIGTKCTATTPGPEQLTDEQAEKGPVRRAPLRVRDRLRVAATSYEAGGNADHDDHDAADQEPEPQAWDSGVAEHDRVRSGGHPDADHGRRHHLGRHLLPVDGGVQRGS